MRFLEPAPHMALAKYYLDHGNRLPAFDILEAARRGHFEEAVFNQAFQLTFRGFDFSHDSRGGSDDPANFIRRSIAAQGTRRPPAF